jgi:hypothetical protein
MTGDRVNLITCSPEAWSCVLQAAVMLGVRDAQGGLDTRTGEELIRRYATEHRGGHKRALRYAYMAGRFHAEHLRDTEER